MIPMQHFDVADHSRGAEFAALSRVVPHRLPSRKFNRSNLGMSPHIQALESRTLFSAVPVAIFTDVGALQSDAGALKADLRQQVPVLMADARSLVKDLHALPPTAQNRGILGKLRSDEMKGIARLRADAGTMLHTGPAKIGRAITDGMNLAAHPTDARAQARLSADLTALQSMDTALSAEFLSDAQNAASTLGADLTALSAANPSATTLEGDVAKTSTDMTGLLTSLQSHFQSTQGDFQHLMTDLNSMM
jgi:hypothetical protein